MAILIPVSVAVNKILFMQAGLKFVPRQCSDLSQSLRLTALHHSAHAGTKSSAEFN